MLRHWLDMRQKDEFSIFWMIHSEFMDFSYCYHALKFTLDFTPERYDVD
jgi:hypothetical protein